MLKLLASITLTALLALPAHAGESDDFFAEDGARIDERNDRNVDQAALLAQQAAQGHINGLLKKYKGTAQEPELLYRLARIQQESAGMQFRVGYGKTAPQAGGDAQLKGYRAYLTSSVATLSRLLKVSPNFDEANVAWFMRARAHEELGSRKAATADYLYLVAKYPKSPDASSSWMSLADFAMDDNQFKRALGYLRQVELKPQDPHHPFALYKMAWCHHNLRDPSTAVGYAERLARFYSGKQGGMTSADFALRENALKDMPEFYYAGYSRKLKGFGLEDAFSRFRKLDDGPALVSMVALFAKKLRTGDHLAAQSRWKHMVLAAGISRPEAAEVVISAYEDHMNNNRYARLVPAAQDLLAVFSLRDPKDPLRVKAEGLLFESASNLQKVLVKEKDSERASIYGSQLAGIYGAFTRLVPEDDARSRAAHVNLAETLFAIKHFDEATRHYRWIVEHGRWSEDAKTAKAVTGGLTVADASLRAISSRYEALRARKVVPGELKAVAIQSVKPKAPNAQVEEWLAWIDTHVSETDSPIENFQFEANRSLYANSQVLPALERLRAFAIKYPSSSYAVPSATLVVDTYIASNQWTQLADATQEFMGVDAWKGSPFSKKLYKIAADAHFKRAEELARSRNYEDAIDQADKFTENYGASPHMTDTLALAGNAAVALKDRGKAIGYFTKITRNEPRTERSGQAILAMAKIEEDRYGFGAASDLYRSYLALPPKARALDDRKMTEMKRRTLHLAWLGGDTAQLGRLLADRSLCSSRGVAQDCTRLRALIPLMRGSVSKSESLRAAKVAGSASAETRAIHATIALESASSLSFEARNRMIAILANGWKQVDGLAKFQLLPRISASVPLVYRLARAHVQRAVPLTANEKTLARRLKLASQVEDSAAVAAKLPWSRIRALVLNEVAWIYQDFSTGVRELPIPRGMPASQRQAYQVMVSRMVSPFDQKAQDLRSKAYQIAARSWVETDALAEIAGALSPNARKRELPEREAIEFSLVKDVDDESWSGADLDKDEPSIILRSRWAAALDRGQWQQVGFFIEESRSKGLMPADVAVVAKAVSLAAAGAQAEGHSELADLCRSRLRGKISNHCGGAS